jgi:hypothetical protein
VGSERRAESWVYQPQQSFEMALVQVYLAMPIDRFASSITSRLE